MLVDTGPLVAILNRHDQHHERCIRVLPSLDLPFVTTAPIMTEALYFLGKHSGRTLQNALWQLRKQGKLEVAPFDDAELDRASDLMQKYADVPMDFADASLVALAEARGERQIFTLDRHFRSYRLPDRRVFHIVPEDV